MMLKNLNAYIHTQSTSLTRYLIEEIIFWFFSWIPGVIGIVLRGVFYKIIIKSKGFPIIENSVRLKQVKNLNLGRNAYLDYGVYLHASPKGIEIGDETLIMHNAELHVFNFRSLPQSRIKIGKKCFIGEFVIMRGQGGIEIGDRVVIAPGVQILAVNHVFPRGLTPESKVPLFDQITAEGIVIEDNVWIGAGALILDGVRIGENSVIGAGSVVTKDIPSYSLVVGVPGRVIKNLTET